VHELGALIRERHDDSRPLIVLGDFNIRPESLSYDLMTQLLGLRDSHKEFREAHPGLSPIDWDGYTIDPRRNGNIKIAKPFVKPHRIDYVWLQDGPGHRTTIDDSRLVLDEKIEGKFLSDHFGVQADLTIDTAYPVE
jgi:endonuclease/exonuclease/phosphatase family metal-dependent hydrolase